MMEIQLQELIDQIKKDGLEAAKTEAEKIIADAKAQSEKIIADAKAQSEKMLADTERENQRMVKSGEEAIKQAGRNLLISFRESVTREADGILSKNVAALYSSEALSQLIIKVVTGWAEKPDTDDITVILNSDDLKSLEETVAAGIKEKIKSGVTFKASDNMDRGFRISVNSGNAYYDYSAEAVVDMLSKYLSPKVTELLKEAE